MVAVFVAHDATTDEWVCQIPYFPPFQSAEVKNVELVVYFAIQRNCEKNVLCFTLE